MTDSPGDICKCGDFRFDHEKIGPRELFMRSTCTEFRLCFTADEMQEAYEEWEKDHRESDA